MTITHYAKTEAFTTADGSQIRELMHPNFSPARNQSLAEATLLPGQATAEHYHPLAEEIYFILRGQGTLRIEGEMRDMVPGDAALIPPGAKHKIWNSGADELVFLCCCAPAYSHDDTVLCE
jgi:mannose-6-phosphate isomerase-like protein (cupin superfamily)